MFCLSPLRRARVWPPSERDVPLSCYVIPDSNIWASERILFSTLGSAELHALTKSGGVITLPEIVSIEIDQVLIEQAAKAIDSVQKSARFLRQLAGQTMTVMAPTDSALRAGLESWIVHGWFL